LTKGSSSVDELRDASAAGADCELLQAGCGVGRQPDALKRSAGRFGGNIPIPVRRRKKVIGDLDIVDNTDPVHSPVAIPYTFLLDRDRTIYKIYNGWWFVGRPTVEEIRLDYRILLSRRADWWYDKKKPSFAEPS
jgi:hypothetical protein